MFWNIKKPKCDHEWFELKRSTDYLGAIPVENMMHLYCPKCDNHKKVNVIEGELLIKACEIKKNYYKQ